MGAKDIRYRRLGYVALNVSDLEKSVRFYRDIVGLTLVDRGNGHAFFRCSDAHHDIALYQAATAGLKRIGWWIESAEALATARGHFEAIGRPILPIPADERATLGIGDSFRTIESTMGATFEFFIDMQGAEGAFQPTHTKIARLGHLVMNSPNRLACERFLLEDMNFRVSDRIEGAVAFMRCFPNPYHHSFGVGDAASGEPQLHHVNFMVTEIDDIGKALYRLQQNDIPIVFGPGRHPPSDSVFLYFLDPDGITIEYSFGMEEFPEVGERAARLMPHTMESIDYWGAKPTPQMARIGAVEHLETADAG